MTAIPSSKTQCPFQHLEQPKNIFVLHFYMLHNNWKHAGTVFPGSSLFFQVWSRQLQRNYNFNVTTVYWSKTENWLFCALCHQTSMANVPHASERGYCTFSWSALLMESPHPQVNSDSGSKSTEINTEHVCLCARNSLQSEAKHSMGVYLQHHVNIIAQAEHQ